MEKYNTPKDIHIQILQSINRSLVGIQENDNIKDVSNIVMGELLKIMGAEIGFMAELKYSKDGSPFFRYRAIAGEKILSKFKDYYNKHFVEQDNLDFYNMDTLYGLVYQTKEPVISNDVINDHRRGGIPKIPKDHPTIYKFMGIPIIYKDGLIGMIGIANKSTDFTSADLELVTPFISIFIFIILEWKKKELVNSSRNRFLLHMSHEIKTPLNGIIGMTQHLLDTDLSKEQLDIVKSISTCNVRLVTIINDIGDFYKMSMGQIVLDKKPYQISNIIKAVHDLYAIDIQLKKLSFTIEIDPDLDTNIITDKKRLTQILNNLLSNSVKYTHEGGIIIKVKLDKTYKDENNPDVVRIIFTISDTGIGIDEIKLKLIFMDFQNLDNGLLVDVNTGRGLGLSICRLLTNIFGGNISIKSQVDKGTDVTFSILSKLTDSNEIIFQFLQEKLGASYGIILCKNSQDRHKLSTLIIRLNMIPIISNTAEEARVYVDQMNLKVSLFIIDKEHNNNTLIVDLNKKFENVIIISLSSATPIPLIDIYTGVNFDVEIIIREMYHILKKRLVSFSDIDQHPENFGIDETKTYQKKGLKEYPDDNALDQMDKLYQKSSYLHQSLSSEYLDGNTQVKILVAEDEITNQKVIKTALIKMGFSNIKIVSDGALMVEAIQAKDYDVVFIDIRMPIMDGYTATQKSVRFLEDNNRRIPILIAVTALEDLYMETHCKEAGIQYVLKKPYTFKDLSKIMKIVKSKVQ